MRRQSRKGMGFMSDMYEGQYIINSFHAVNGETGEVITATENGYIDLEEGDKVVFQGIYPGDKYVSVNTLVFFAGDSTPVKVAINDNELYPFYIDAGTRRGIKDMCIHSFTALVDCQLYYEGICTEP